MRIGARRLRSALSLARGLAPDAALAPIVAEVKWLARALGPARDLDVFALETLPSLRQATAAGAGGAGAARRDPSQPCPEDGARRHCFRALHPLRAGRRRTGLGSGAGSRSRQRRSRVARHARPRSARDVLRRRHRKLEEAGPGLASATPAERHVARIAAKRLRYAAEFFAPLFPGKRGRTYRKALARLQDVLGASTMRLLRRRSRELAGPQVVAAAAFDGWTAAQSAMLAPELASAWQAFARARSFWTRD